MERLRPIDELSPEEIELQIGYAQRDYEDRMQNLMGEHRRRMQELHATLNEARERERRERIERDATAP